LGFSVNSSCINFRYFNLFILIYIKWLFCKTLWFISISLFWYEPILHKLNTFGICSSFWNLSFGLLATRCLRRLNMFCGLIESIISISYRLYFLNLLFLLIFLTLILTLFWWLFRLFGSLLALQFANTISLWYIRVLLLNVLLISIYCMFVWKLIFIFIEDRSYVLAPLSSTEKRWRIDIITFIIYGAQLMIIKTYYLLIPILMVA